jgi:hypothetical protein
MGICKADVLAVLFKVLLLIVVDAVLTLDELDDEDVDELAGDANKTCDCLLFI